MLHLKNPFYDALAYLLAFVAQRSIRLRMYYLPWSNVSMYPMSSTLEYLKNPTTSHSGAHFEKVRIIVNILDFSNLIVFF
jgi:hypothetical protein